MLTFSFKGVPINRWVNSVGLVALSYFYGQTVQCSCLFYSQSHDLKSTQHVFHILKSRMKPKGPNTNDRKGCATKNLIGEVDRQHFISIVGQEFHNKLSVLLEFRWIDRKLDFCTSFKA